MKITKLLLPACLLLACTQAATADLITNGGFETGNFTGWSVSDDPYDNTTVEKASSDPNNLVIPFSGEYVARLGTFDVDGTLSQTIADAAGQPYQLSMWLKSDGNTPNDFNISWNGTTIYSQTDIPVLNYFNIALNVTGTGTDTLLIGERNDIGYLYLDNVSLNSVPTPGTFALLGMGLAGLAYLQCKKS